MMVEPLHNVIVYPDVHAMSLAAAERLRQAAGDTLPDTNRLMVALSGGSTPKRLFQILSRPPFAQSLPWDKIHFFWCDERLVPPEHAESNFGQAFEELFSQVNIPAENLHRIRGEDPPAQAAEAYRRELENYHAGGLKWPRFDLAFLGLGADGHTASLFPDAIPPEERLSPVYALTANYQGRPAGRITLTPLALNSARQLIVMVVGKDKAHAVSETLYGASDPEKWPAQRIRPMDGQLSWWLDEDAASG